MTKKEQIIQEIFKKIESQYPDFTAGKTDFAFCKIGIPSGTPRQSD